jgi:HEPN domain-containing protein
VNEYLDSVIFGTFIEKAVVPDIHLKKEDIEAYYKEHLREFSSPEMMRITSLAFKKKDDAESAAEKLRKGTDYNWLVSNAEGQVEKDAKDLLVFEGNLITVKSMPEVLQKALAGAKADEVKVGEGPAGYYYLMLIKQVVPSQSEELEKVKDEIVQTLIAKKLKNAVDEWGAKLRKAGDVKFYLSQSN